MSDFSQLRSNEEELTSPSSDEKMDTGSESFRSQDTPNSIRSSDFEDHPEIAEQSVLRLQNPEEIENFFRSKQSDDRISEISDNAISKSSDEDNFSKHQSLEDNFLSINRSDDVISKTSESLMSKSSDDDENFLSLQYSNGFGNLKTPDVFKHFQTNTDVKSVVESNTDNFKNHENVTNTPGAKQTEDTNSESFKSPKKTNQDKTKKCDNKNFESTQTEISKSPKKSALNALKTEDLSDSFINKMSSLKLDSPKDVRPKNVGVSPPKFSSTLTLTTNHPLMGLGSPDEFPDLIPKKHKEEDRDLSLSSIEDERPSETNGLYSPQTNTSKNNLYFTENFVTAESHILSDSLDLPPDVVTRVGRRKIVPRFELTPQRNVESNADRHKVEFESKSHSTPKCSLPVDIAPAELHSGVAEWCESPSQLRAVPNFDLPIEMSSAIGMHNELESPDVVSSSTQEERSAYEARLDPYTGSVALRQTAPREQHNQPPSQRRKIMLPPAEDSCSLDSVSASSMESEDEPPALEPHPALAPHPAPEHDEDDSDDDTKRSKSTNTISYTSEPIPEYSLCEELSNERGWVSVHNHACDVKVIEPYKRVLSHGGYSSSGAALIVFSACHLPDNTRLDYTYVMDNLFLYVIWSLERLVTEEYILVYLHGSAGRRRLPAFHWLHECYKLIDRRLRKSLKQLYLVHPTFWLKSFVLITKPFVSSKFFKKLSYVKSLDELMEQVPVDPNAIPEIVKLYDANQKR